MTDCPERETLQRLLNEEVDQSERAAIERHVQICVACQETLAQISDDTEMQPWYRLHRGDVDSLWREQLGTVEQRIQGRRFGDYELLEEIGRGGMGVVYKARQMSLKRIVAVKMILAGRLASADDVKRLRREAEAAAELRHPNIVAIHEVGENEGQHFFSMDLVEGKSLDQIVRENPLSGKKASQYLKSIAETIHYAHTRGILHRDLKPANVLISAADQPHVTDFGLAKRIVGESKLSRTGQVLGTPAFMSPEQAQGKDGRLSPASDVYSLGAVLYTLLVGRPPFQAETPWDTMLQVLEVEPVPPRLINPKIDRDLETICMKCLEKDAGRRYASARDLADDVGRYLDGEPIRARPISPIERGVRWCRRKPIVAGLSAAVALLLIALSAVSTLAAARLAAARDVAISSERKADARFLEARKAVDDFLTGIAESKELKATPGTQQTRHRLLERAKDYYESFLRENPDDPKLRQASAETYFRLARITRELSPGPRVVELYGESASIYEKMLNEDPSAHLVARELSTVLNNMGVLLMEMNKTNDALAVYERAREIQERLVRHDPADTDFARVMARTYGNLGNLNDRLAKRVEALEWYEKALAIQKKLVDQHPDVARYRYELSMTYNNIGLYYALVGKPAESLEWYQKALEIQNRLVRENPGAADFGTELAATYNHVGNLHIDVGNSTDALASFESAIAIQHSLKQDNPNVPAFAEAVARTYTNLARLQELRSESDAALDAYQQAIVIQEKLVRDHPAVSNFAADLATMHSNLGALLRSMRLLNEALVAHQQALTIRLKLGEQHPAIPRFAHAVASSLVNIANVQSAMNLPQDARTMCEKAMAIQEKLVAQDSGSVEMLAQLATIHHNLGSIHARLGIPDAARAEFEKAREIREKLVAEHSSISEYSTLLAGTCVNLGKLARDQNGPKESLEYYARAIELLEAILRPGVRNSFAEQTLRDAYKSRAESLSALDRPSEAIPDWQRASELADGLQQILLKLGRAVAMAHSGDHARASADAQTIAEQNAMDHDILYSIACVYAVSSAAARKDSNLAPADRVSLPDRYAVQAIEWLRKAAQHGFQNVDHMLQDSDLNPLRDRQDFRSLVQELRSK